MRKSVSVLLFFLLGSIASGQTPSLVLSPGAEISLLTLGPGEDLYSSFGHSALRVRDPAHQLDQIYNFGTFDFNEPNFYVKFVRGKLLYRLSVQTFTSMLLEAQAQNRTLVEQTLGLTPAQKQQLFSNLEINARPENRFYRYDFYFDNCSTRLRDAVERVCGKELQFRLTLNPPRTFRQLLDPYLVAKPYADLGMDLGQGAVADRVASPYQSMFLPEYLMNGFGTATLLHQGKPGVLVVRTQALFRAAPIVPVRNFFPPVALTGVAGVVIVAVTLRDYRQGRRSRWLDGILYFFTGLIGALLLFLWLGTDHAVTARNWNLTWALPTHLPVGFWLTRQRISGWVAWYLVGSGVLTLVVLLCWPGLPQELDSELVPFVAALAIRSVYVFLAAQKRVGAATMQPQT